ncbi:MAG: PilZ domain-containing protein [Nitrospira sp.]|nr:PilZ domain-containing protein [Nitrospira sp.]
MSTPSCVEQQECPSQQNRRQANREFGSFELIYSGMDACQILIGDGVMTDLSRNGIGIQGEHMLRVGMEFSLFVALPDDADPLCIIDARVVWAAGNRFGVEIPGLSTAAYARLKENLRNSVRLGCAVSADTITV